MEQLAISQSQQAGKWLVIPRRQERFCQIIFGTFYA
jgi:hypothetical protein